MEFGMSEKNPTEEGLKSTKFSKIFTKEINSG
jgi:hypothetical protein